MSVLRSTYVSDGCQLEPVTVTVVPVGPRNGESATIGPPIIVNTADADGPGVGIASAAGNAVTR